MEVTVMEVAVITITVTSLPFSIRVTSILELCIGELLRMPASTCLITVLLWCRLQEETGEGNGLAGAWLWWPFLLLIQILLIFPAKLKVHF